MQVYVHPRSYLQSEHSEARQPNQVSDLSEGADVVAGDVKIVQFSQQI